MEQDNRPTYIFDKDKVFAISDGKVVASASHIDEVEAILAEPKEILPKTATHIVSPNGLKGQILNRHEDVWGDVVTVRFENGRIASFHTTAADDISFTIEEPESELSPVEQLEGRLDEDFSADKASLQERLETLSDITVHASAAVKTASYEDQVKLDGIVAMARHEAAEIKEVIADYDDDIAQKGYAPPAPFKVQAAEQESMGGNDGSWLNNTLDEMIAETDSVDYDKFMDEGPELFVADVDSGALADAGTTRSMASSYVRSRTIGIESKVAKEYENAFLARVEQVRRQELYDRKTSMAREASTQEESIPGPDEGLFW